MNIKSRLVPITIGLVMILILYFSIIAPFLCKNNHSDPIWFYDIHVFDASFDNEYYKFLGKDGLQYGIIITSVILNDGENNILADISFPISYEPGVYNFTFKFPIVVTGNAGNHTMSIIYEVDCGYEQTELVTIFFNSTI